jgi:hypothetical protein
MNLVVFASRDQPEVYDRAERFVKLVRGDGFAARLVDKLSSNVGDLLLVAQYGVVEQVVVVMLEADEVVGRLARLPAPSDLKRAIGLLQNPTPEA